MSSLTEQSEQRKKRLQELKRTAEQIKFKQYEPESKELKKLKTIQPALGPTASDTVEKRAQEISEKVVEEEAQKSKELDLTNLKPKKPNWDLKRDLEKKLEKLEKSTLLQISNLIRERLREKGDLTDSQF
jgi:coiled-coil domain-containing protein 12